MDRVVNGRPAGEGAVTVTSQEVPYKVRGINASLDQDGEKITVVSFAGTMFFHKQDKVGVIDGLRRLADMIERNVL